MPPNPNAECRQRFHAKAPSRQARRRPSVFWCLCGLACVLIPASVDAADQPVSRDPRLAIRLFASDPDIVTPTGLDVDHRGRVFAIESNTHFPPEGYDRHPTDRLLLFEDLDRDGHAEQPVVFADGFVHAMSVAVRTSFEAGKPDSVLVATRRAIWVLHDDDGDGRADRRKRIIFLDTPGDYPHDGLAGFAFDAMGWMYFGLGENLGAKYKLIGSDGVTLSGGGEGGNIYRCRLDGTKLVHRATGFWNPHASCVDAFGRLFSVDNDPDSLPPCRLMHIIDGGDYGYRYRNGRKGFHPFTSWNGEIPGTLPMVAGTGEAPSGIVAYESDGLPDEYLGNLLVTSWGDHRIDRFRLKPRGASFSSVLEPLIQGGVNFRPVGLAVGPDGSLYCTDWVLRDYKLHLRGRIWRISAKKSPLRSRVDASSLSNKQPVGELSRSVRSTHLPLRRRAAGVLAETSAGRARLKQLVADHDLPVRSRVEVLWAMATVDPKVEDFGFLRPGVGRARVAGGATEVEIATIELIGSPQFPFDPRRRNFLDDKSVAETLWVPDPPGGAVPSPAHRARWAAAAMRILPINDVVGLLSGNDPFLVTAALTPGLRENVIDEAFFKAFSKAWTPGSSLKAGSKRTFFTLFALRHSDRKAPTPAALLGSPGGLEGSSRRLVIQWIAEHRRTDLRGLVAAVLDDPTISADLFRTTLAALDMLDGGDPKKIDETSPSKYVLPLLRDAKRPPAVRAQALRLVEPTDKALDERLMRELLGSEYQPLVLETVRTLQMSPTKFAPQLIASVATDADRGLALRAEAVAGLGAAVAANRATPGIIGMLTRWLESNNRVLVTEALRSLRGGVGTDPAIRQAVLKFAERFKSVDEPTPDDRAWVDQVAAALREARRPVPGHVARLASRRPGKTDAWVRRLAEGGDPAAGRRVFFDAAGAACARCHTVNGRGRHVGPDLSVVARSRNRRQLVESILDPSREIAPQFVTWTLVTTAGKVLTGIIVYENRDRLTIEDADGKQVNLANTEIDLRKPQAKSMMPEKLVEKLTVGEFRDLLAFLERLR